MKRTVVAYILLTLSGVVSILPCIVIPILFPLYIVLAVLTVKVIFDNMRLDAESINPLICPASFVTIPQLLIVYFWVAGFGENFEDYAIYVITGSEVVLLIGFLVIFITVKRVLKGLVSVR
jgi:hypothetical protein